MGAGVPESVWEAPKPPRVCGVHRSPAAEAEAGIGTPGPVTAGDPERPARRNRSTANPGEQGTIPQVRPAVPARGNAAGLVERSRGNAAGLAGRSWRGLCREGRSSAVGGGSAVGSVGLFRCAVVPGGSVELS
ncbi:hypothetical protein GCM10022222_48220 [Amycolatopsis ultiminotia]|uniref:Uncharacterized protein n=1 Tax=Amycolatopsis ultiminotia TaxID=543629 RepID=A0ABP6X0F8_9PSEU